MGRPPMNAAPVPAPVSSRPVRWRFALLFAVLAGFFLMHGIFAVDSCAESSSSVVSAPQVKPAVMQPTDAAAAPTIAGTAVSQTCGCQDAMGATCIPSRSQDEAALLAMLLAGFAAMPAGGSVLGGVLRSVSALGAGGRRSRSSVPVRALVCVSRT